MSCFLFNIKPIFNPYFVFKVQFSSEFTQPLLKEDLYNALIPPKIPESLPSSEDNTFLQDITTKLQSTTSIIPAIAPIIEHSFSNDVNIHIDELTVVNAEEAQESPTKTCHNPDVKKIFEEIGRQEFEDEIIFKKSKHRKKPSSTTISTSSLSSNSSEEKELSYTRSTIMNLSAVGTLPDLRSPESINYDIEYKEKILADILNLDRVKLFESKDNALVREENDSEKKNIVQCVTNYDLMNNIKTDRLCRNSKGSTSENKNSHEITYRTERCDDVFSKNLKDDVRFKNQIPQNQVMSKNENDINIERINSEDDPILKRVEISGEQSIDSKMPNDMPACMNIPNDWRLSDIQVRERTVSGLSDNSLSDWEIV